MIEIDAAESAPALRPLFDPDAPDHPRLFSALRGLHPSRAWVDATPSPRWCALRSGWFGRTFLGGTAGADELAPAIEALRASGQVVLDRADPRTAALAPNAERMDRIEFQGRPPDHPALERLAASLPAGLAVCPVTRERFDACRWRDDLLAVFGSGAVFVERSLGYVLLDGEEILSEAHAFFWGDGDVEIGTVTGEAHRGAGHAPIVCAHLVRACEARGYATYWGCDLGNPASAAVARKLGYARERPVAFAVLPARG